MKTYLDCIPCFFKQALEASRIAGADEELQRQVLEAVAGALPEFPLEASPPEMGRIIYGLVKAYTGSDDPYRRIKEQSNRLALSIYDKAVDILARSNDRLTNAVAMAIAGNIIDFGVSNTLDIGVELERILAAERNTIDTEDRTFFDIDSLRETLAGARSVLYLGDNAGETVFDRILMEEIMRMDETKTIAYAVKERPIINDALEKDAVDCGIDAVAEIVSSGSEAPGTIPALCSAEFMTRFRTADIVISKGQGNFEGLSDVGRPVFFLLMAKCPVIAADIGCQVGDIVLLHHVPGEIGPGGV
jgi:uncharacterized protein with ATP-grasp and redox domains